MSVGSSKIFDFVLVRNIFYVILCFGDFFCFSGSVFGSRICIDLCFQRLQFEGSNEFSQIWLILITVHPSFFSSSFGSTAGAGFFVKTVKNSFGSPFWLTVVDALMNYDS